MSKDELIDIVDLRGNILYSESRHVAHQQSLLHRVVALLSINEINGERYCLFSQRSSSKSNFPLKFDFLSSGHLTVGEEIIDSTREFREELGVDLTFSSLNFLGDFLLETDVSKKGKNFLVRELLSLFITKNISLPIFDQKEIEKIIYVKCRDLNLILLEGAPYFTLLEGKLIESSELIKVNDFVPAKGNFYIDILSNVLEISKAL